MDAEHEVFLPIPQTQWPNTNKGSRDIVFNCIMWTSCNGESKSPATGCEIEMMVNCRRGRAW